MRGRISQSCGVLAVDFRECDAREIQVAYENLALRLCTSRAERRVLLHTGSEDADVHYALLAAVRAVAQAGAAPLALQVAFVGASPTLASVCSAMGSDLRGLGCEARLFRVVNSAVRWLLAHEPAIV